MEVFREAVVLAGGGGLIALTECVYATPCELWPLSLPAGGLRISRNGFKAKVINYSRTFFLNGNLLLHVSLRVVQ